MDNHYCPAGATGLNEFTADEVFDPREFGLHCSGL
jgi:hypothetical protein